MWLPQSSPEFELPVPHYIQLNNTGGEGARECGLTSATMVGDYFLAGEISREAYQRKMREPEDFYATILSRHGDTTDWNAHVRALKDLGIISYFSTTASLNDVSHSLHCGCPVMAGTKYKSSGHVVVYTGRCKKGFLVKCPNGIRDGKSNNWITRFWENSQATTDLYSWSLLKDIYTDLGDEAGYALFVTEVRGKKTGVKEGM